MSRTRPRPSWRTVLVSGLCSVMVAGTVVGLTTGGEQSGQAADVERAAPSTPVIWDGTPSVTFLGDSWTEGEGATDLRGYAYLAGDRLGWEYEVLGVGGSGYTRPGGSTTFGQRVDPVVRTDPDVVVVQGSLNERRGGRFDVLEATALAALSRLRAGLDPETQILVVGASYAPGTPHPTIDWINAAIGSAAEQAGLTFVDPAAENWTDPTDATIWADPDHPNDAGHRVIADHVVELLRGLAER